LDLQRAQQATNSQQQQLMQLFSLQSIFDQKAAEGTGNGENP
jgi:hypothetical protein